VVLQKQLIRRDVASGSGRDLSFNVKVVVLCSVTVAALTNLLFFESLGGIHFFTECPKVSQSRR
jgi:hypothetical protein